MSNQVTTSPITDAAFEDCNGGSRGLHHVARKMRELEEIARALMRTCYDEANRLANHGHGGFDHLVMTQLYDAANEAKRKMGQ